MNFKKILISLLALSIALAFASCKDKEEDPVCAGHVDKNDDGKCDKCGEAYDDGAEEPEIVKEQCTFTVVDSEGNTISGAKFTVTFGSTAESLTSDANGKATASLYPGTYTVDFDYDSIPSGFQPSTLSVKVSATEKSFELIVVDNNPDGTSEKPYYISENETPLALSAGEEVFYVLRGSAGKKLVIENENVTVVFNGNTYEPIEGVIEIEITSNGEVMQMNTFSVKNNSASSVNVVINLVSPLGSMDNPIVMTENTVTANAPIDGSVCYKWTASANGVVIVSSENERNNISLTNRTTNAVSALTEGDTGGVYMMVSEGDEVVIFVSAMAAKNDDSATVEIEFNAALYAGTESDPIPVLKNSVDVSLYANATLVFKAENGGTLKIADENVTVTYNGTPYTPSSLGIINVDIAAGAAFAVTNTSDAMNGVEIEIN